MATWTISGILGFLTGGAFIWFAKDRLIMMVKGGNALAADLRAKAAKVEGIF